jgi:hypothetical protein
MTRVKKIECVERKVDVIVVTRNAARQVQTDGSAQVGVQGRGPVQFSRWQLRRVAPSATCAQNSPYVQRGSSTGPHDNQATT